MSTGIVIAAVKVEIAKIKRMRVILIYAGSFYPTEREREIRGYIYRCS